MTNEQKILAVLKRAKGAGVCDDCLEIAADVHPRQQVNQICRRIKGIARRNGTCSAANHGREKLLNFLVDAGPQPPDPGRGTQRTDGQGIDQTVTLSDWRSEADKFLDRIEGTSKDYFRVRVNRLGREGSITSALHDKMMILYSWRNQVVKERKLLDSDEWNLAMKYIDECRFAWKGTTR